MTKSRGLIAKRGTRAAWVKQEQGRHVCGCGCGQPIKLRPEHYNEGIPHFLHGHNTTVTHVKPKPERQSCACGCGMLASAGRRFVSGHNNRDQQHSDTTKAKISQGMQGANNPWYGKKPPNYRGWYRTQDGYILREAPSHPFASGRGVMEHRLVLEQHLRSTDPASSYLIGVEGELYLRPGIQVHHIDGVKDNNVVSNLRPMTRSEHSRWHQQHRHPHP